MKCPKNKKHKVELVKMDFNMANVQQLWFYCWNCEKMFTRKPKYMH